MMHSRPGLIVGSVSKEDPRIASRRWRATPWTTGTSGFETRLRAADKHNCSVIAVGERYFFFSSFVTERTSWTGEHNPGVELWTDRTD